MYRIRVILIILLFTLTILLSGCNQDQNNSQTVTADIETRVNIPEEREVANIHSSVECVECHGTEEEPLDKSKQCVNCHVLEDLDNEKASIFHSELPSDTNCIECHFNHIGLNTFRYFIKYEYWDKHEFLGFSLNSHLSSLSQDPTACQVCHKSNETSLTVTECLYCHQSENQIWMQNHVITYSELCTNCHDGLETITSDFDHANTEFILTGSHIATSCIGCHTQISDGLFEITSYECISCHSNSYTHNNELMTNCSSCHNTDQWNQISFAHDFGSFTLNGGHSGLSCTSCHQISPFTKPDSNCVSCHSNTAPHDTKYGTDCILCHNTSYWSTVNFSHLSNFTDCISCHSNSQPANHFNQQCSNCHNSNAWKPANFSHTFPLNHNGANSLCATCHVNNNFTSYTCFNCHNESNIADEHEERGSYSNCIQCHANGTKPEDDDHDDDD